MSVDVSTHMYMCLDLHIVVLGSYIYTNMYILRSTCRGVLLVLTYLHTSICAETYILWYWDHISTLICVYLDLHVVVYYEC